MVRSLPGQRSSLSMPLAAQRSLVDLSVSSNGMLEVSGSLPAGASTCAFCFRLLWVEYPTDGDYRLRALGIGCAGIFGPPTFDRKPPIRGGDSFRVP